MQKLTIADVKKACGTRTPVLNVKVNAEYETTHFDTVDEMIDAINKYLPTHTIAAITPYDSGNEHLLDVFMELQ